MVINFLRLSKTLSKNGKSKSAHYLEIQEGLCTKGVLIGARSVAWPEHEIDALNAARIAGMAEDEIRVLVCELEAKRKTFARKAGAE
jgi:prophage regulatory protein